LRPIYKAFWEHATADPTNVERLFTGPDGESVSENVAVSTGNGLFVVDVDVKKGKNGKASLEKLKAEGLDVDTLTIGTPSTGLHLYYSGDPALAFRSAVNWRGLEGIDIRGEHSYVNAPGSVKPDGGEYRVIRDVPIRPIAETFIADLARPRRARGDAIQETADFEDDWAIGEAIKYLMTAEPEAGAGSRHDALIRIGHNLFDLGITRETATNLIEEHWPQAPEVTERIDYQIDNLATNRAKAGKKWGVAHPRSRPSVYETFKRVYLSRREDEGPGNDNRAPLEPRPIVAPSRKRIPRRPWVVDGLAVRRLVTALIAPPGMGKTQWLASLATAVATSRGDVLGAEIIERTKVWYWNQEDDEDELARRFASVRIFHGLEDSAFEHEGRPMLFVNSGTHSPFMLAKREPSGALTRTPDVGRIVKKIRAHEIGLFIMDPVVEFHEGEENDNVQKKVWGLARSIAEEADCAVVVAAHSRKPPAAASDGFAGDLDSLRGASSQGGVVRVALTLYNMSAKDARDVGVPEHDRRLYVKLNDAKQNLRLATDDPKWLKRESVNIDPDAGEDRGPENVGCLVPCTLEKRVRVEADILALLAKSARDKFKKGDTLRINEIVAAMATGDQQAFVDPKNRARQVEVAIAEAGLSWGVAMRLVIPTCEGSITLLRGKATAPLRIQYGAPTQERKHERPTSSNQREEVHEEVP